MKYTRVHMESIGYELPPVVITSDDLEHWLEGQRRKQYTPGHGKASKRKSEKRFAYSEATIAGQTGVEMEALTAVSIALLTVYDMAKAVDRGMRIEGIRLISKEGGRTGAWRAEE